MFWLKYDTELITKKIIDIFVKIFKTKEVWAHWSLCPMSGKWPVMYICVLVVSILLFSTILIFDFGIVPTMWYFRIVPTMWYFRIVPTVWYFGIVPTVWYFEIVPTMWYFLFSFYFLLWLFYSNSLKTRTLIFTERKFRQWWSTIPPISTKLSINVLVWTIK